MAKELTTENIEATIAPVIERVVGEVVGPLLNEVMDRISERFDRLDKEYPQHESRISHIERHLSRKRSFPRLEPAVEEN